MNQKSIESKVKCIECLIGKDISINEISQQECVYLDDCEDISNDFNIVNETPIKCVNCEEGILVVQEDNESDTVMH